jgi:hypothetical protein
VCACCATMVVSQQNSIFVCLNIMELASLCVSYVWCVFRLMRRVEVGGRGEWVRGRAGADR